MHVNYVSIELEGKMGNRKDKGTKQHWDLCAIGASIS